MSAEQKLPSGYYEIIFQLFSFTTFPQSFMKREAISKVKQFTNNCLKQMRVDRRNIGRFLVK